MNLRRHGFTLVELLVVAMLIVLLASIALAAMAGALEDAKRSRTRAQIAKLHSLVMTKWESYHTRRVSVKVPYADPSTYRRTVNLVRMFGLRDLQRMEMPDRYTDISSNPVGSAHGLASPLLPLPLPALLKAYRRRLSAGYSTNYEGAECLYLMLSIPSEDGSNPLEFLSEKEIGDIDEDGMPEIHDAWGRPIYFLRWAPGFRSDLQSGNPTKGGDAFDPYFLDDPNKTHYTLFPLIFSAGPDGGYDVNVEASGTPVPAVSTTPPCSPYVSANIGQAIDTNGNGRLEFYDNIHNHLIDAGR